MTSKFQAVNTPLTTLKDLVFSLEQKFLIDFFVNASDRVTEFLFFL